MRVRNHITLIGNVGQQPTVKTLPSGTSLVEFSLATNEYYKDRDGNRQQRTDWHRVKAFGGTADVLGRYLSRGSKVAVMGTLRYSKWQDQHGQSRTSADIIVSEFSFLDARNGADDSAESEALEAADMTINEPAPKKTTKRRTKKAGTKKTAPEAEMTAAEDLPF